MRRMIVLLVVLAALLLSVIPALAQDEVLTIYSGRNESLIGPLLESFSDISGIEIAVLYGGTATLAAQILEEGENSPADIFIAQDAGALGALAKAGLLGELPEALTGLVSDPALFRLTACGWALADARACSSMTRTRWRLRGWNCQTRSST